MQKSRETKIFILYSEDFYSKMKQKQVNLTECLCAYIGISRPGDFPSIYRSLWATFNKWHLIHVFSFSSHLIHDIGCHSIAWISLHYNYSKSFHRHLVSLSTDSTCEVLTIFYDFGCHSTACIGDWTNRRSVLMSVKCKRAGCKAIQ